MPSIVIAAHNEENVIGQTLDTLRDQAASSRFQVVVSANGCTDRTVAVATRPGVTVIDRPEPGKAGAINAGERVADGFPRIYLDADIRVPPGALTAILDRFAQSPSTLAVVPRRRLNTIGRPWPVRAYFAINERLPVFRNGLFGRGMIALSERGRSRFNEFPALIADDLFLDSLFSDTEKAELPGTEVVVEAPYTTRDLIRRLVRVRRGNAEMRAAGGALEVGARVRPADRWAWLRDVVLPTPRLAGASVAYVSITVIAAVLARRRSPVGGVWARDESTRGQHPPARNEASA